MAKPKREATRGDVRRIERVINNLKACRDVLREVGAGKSADYVARALKSVEGARNHADRLARAKPEPCCLTHCDDCRAGVC